MNGSHNFNYAVCSPLGMLQKINPEQQNFLSDYVCTPGKMLKVTTKVSNTVFNLNDQPFQGPPPIASLAILQIGDTKKFLDISIRWDENDNSQFEVHLVI